MEQPTRCRLPNGVPLCSACGGSDVYCDRRLPESVRSHEVLWGECIAGALYVEDFRRIARSAGFEDPRVLSASRIEVNDPELKAIVGEAQFYSITYR